MLAWFMANAVNIIIGLLLLAAVGTVVWRLLRRRSRGVTGCASCSGCAAAADCRSHRQPHA